MSIKLKHGLNKVIQQIHGKFNVNYFVDVY